MGSRIIRQLFFFIIFLVFPVFIFSELAFSQTVPSAAKAGAVEKSFEEAKVKKEKKDIPTLEIDLPKEELAVVDTRQKFLVKDFVFKGNSVLTGAYLRKILKKYRYKELTLKDLQDACLKVSNEYKRRGYFLARAYLPVQEIKNGIVQIEVIEGTLGAVRIEGSKYYNKSFIKRHFRPTTRKGIINYSCLLKSLLILNNYPDLNLQAMLEQGKKPGTVDVVLKVKDKLPRHFGADYNNFGSRYISRHRSGATIEYSNFFWAGDKLSLRGVAGSPERTVKFAFGEYSFPINGYGTRFGLSYTWSDFNVQREYRRLDAGGRTKIYGCSFSHPVVKSRRGNLEYLLGFDYKRAKNYLLGIENSDDELRVFKSGVTGDFLDGFQGRNYFSLLCSKGQSGIMGALRRKNDPRASQLGAGGNFTKGNFDLARYQKFFWDTYILVKGSAQVTSTVLPILEQFSIGGADSVRGFPQSEHLGDYGYTGTFEWRVFPPFISNKRIPFTHRTFKETIQFLGFVDYGKVLNKKAVVGEEKHYEISGAGVGARLNFTNDISFRVDVGFPMSGKEPSDGNNSQVYIQAMARF